MPDEKTGDKPPGVPYPANYSHRWSGICPGNLGLKAAYWVDQPGGEVVFRPIAGWITHNSENLAVPGEPETHGLLPLVVSDDDWPVYAGNVARYIRVVPVDATAEYTKEKAGTPGQEPQINTRFTGQA